LTDAAASAPGFAAFVAFFTGAGSAGAATAGIASFSLRITGASTVDDADFTNSPSS
jgi:hypothetical protein